MNFASRSRTRLAFGPGNCVTSRGSFISVAVIISSSCNCKKNARRLMWISDRRADVCAQTDFNPSALCQERGNLIDAVEVGTYLGGGKTAWESLVVCMLHLVFLRTLPSPISSIRIPLSASPLLVRSAVYKSHLYLAH